MIVAANSGRYLAESARRGGFQVAVADCYADRDTHAVAGRVVHAAPARPAGLAAAAASLHPRGQARPRLVWGSGFEAHPHLLGALGHRFELAGNPPGVVALLSQPRRLFRLLESLGIAHPEVRFEACARPGWLCKQAGGSGGLGVWRANEAPAAARPDAYWQRRVSGEPFSVTFAADGRHAAILGLNALASRPLGPRPHVYQGAVSGFTPGRRACRRLQGYVDRLTRAFGLRGINGIDLLLDGGEPLFLELNPRPPATTELYEADFPAGAVAAHVQASEGRLPAFRGASAIRGCRVLYASRALQAPATAWPEWVKDRPVPGTALCPGEPVCTVHAEGTTAATVERLLLQRQAQAQALLGGTGARVAA